jgi:hypothetical protein
MKTSHIEQVRQDAATLKTEVLNILGWDELRYAEYQEAMGRRYLEDVVGAGPEYTEEITRSGLYWSWWKLHWMRRDREFLDMSGLLFRHEHEGYYMELHQPGTMVFRPHSVVLEASYANMIHRLVKEVVS